MTRTKRKRESGEKGRERGRERDDEEKGRERDDDDNEGREMMRNEE